MYSKYNNNYLNNNFYRNITGGLQFTILDTHDTLHFGGGGTKGPISAKILPIFADFT